MAAGGIILNSINTIYKFNTCSSIFPGFLSQIRHYAARKGTRARKEKKKKAKVVEVKLTFEEKVRRSKKITIQKPEALTDTDENKIEAVDDVYVVKNFKKKVYPFAETIHCHREFLHPTMLNATDSIVQAFVELNLEGVKKTKPVAAFNKIVSVKYNFDQGEKKKILAFCKTEEDVRDALNEGAALAGGSDIIKLIMDGDIELRNYDTVVAHPSMLSEIVMLRGLLKKKYPSIKTGTLGLDLKRLVYTHLNGIEYHVEPYLDFPKFGKATVSIGKLGMDETHLESNLQSIVDSIMTAKPRRPGSFITRIHILCPPSNEKFLINHSLYVPVEEEPIDKTKKEEDSDDEDEVAEAITG